MVGLIPPINTCTVNIEFFQLKKQSLPPRPTKFPLNMPNWISGLVHVYDTETMILVNL